ncbi:MAG: 3-methyl-2-oxobutanoate hydroxymethyltransferase [Desulfitobacterium sp.]|nr:3-methyl-2-oxobutanoate hydroxymethyltransferase [Desulfitobacterium sp.]
MKKLVPDFFAMKEKKEKITMLTAYDYPSARWAEEAGVDMILVGDSLGNVVLGYDSTVPVTMEDMIHHTKAVRRGAPETFVVTDMPFMTYATVEDALRNGARIIQEGGADAVKLEGGEHFAPIVEALVNSGIPVVGHIGLTPQTTTQLGGFKVQGKDLESARRLLRDAEALDRAGIFALTLEAIPLEVAKTISEKISAPTIGIGAGSYCDGQVLVFHDMLGIFDRFKPKFVKVYADLKSHGIEGIRNYVKEVKEGTFPDNTQHTYAASEDLQGKLYGD